VWTLSNAEIMLRRDLAVFFFFFVDFFVLAALIVSFVMAQKRSFWPSCTRSMPDVSTPARFRPGSWYVVVLNQLVGAGSCSARSKDTKYGQKMGVAAPVSAWARDRAHTDSTGVTRGPRHTQSL
jgi:hypothetical protein